MSGVLTVIKFFAVLAVVGLLGGGYLYLTKWTQRFEDNSVGNSEVLDKIVVDGENGDFVPGQREYDRSLELLAMDRKDEAVEKLLFIQNLYSDSENGAEARRILGEINLDEILSIENMSNKMIYTIKPGEGYLNVANNSRTTLDCMMFLNGLLEMSPLHVGDELVVMSLNFKLVVDLAKRRIELFRPDEEKKEHIFVKDYPIMKLDLASLRGKSIHSKISRKQGEINGEVVRPALSGYRHATKVLGFKAGRHFIQMRPVPERDEEDPGRGIFLMNSDMEELSMLIRIGNEVEIKPAG
ncbi:MAG: hypothetical protein ISR39_15395 [Akkermansiaceae bacterium]|jgi:hypothetical protein|nr:hypothetical protein [Akkermansiaceae bacterium]OUV18697.1 MAG: hypothetical protein CBC46_01010 [Verrucomicrobiaceae bacterium TMED86]